MGDLWKQHCADERAEGLDGNSIGFSKADPGSTVAVVANSS